MSKLGLGITLVSASFLSFIGGAFTREKELQKIKGELCKIIKELQRTKKLLEVDNTCLNANRIIDKNELNEKS